MARVGKDLFDTVVIGALMQSQLIEVVESKQGVPAYYLAPAYKRQSRVIVMVCLALEVIVASEGSDCELGERLDIVQLQELAQARVLAARSSSTLG